MRKLTIDDYEISISSEGAVVKYGKFTATLAELEATGHLTSKVGRTHEPPAWVVNKLAQAARALAEA